jgi:hypothetical protein
MVDSSFKEPVLYLNSGRGLFPAMVICPTATICEGTPESEPPVS